MFRLTLPTTLTTGFFLLLGFVAQTPVVSAEVFVLQGEGFDADTLAYLQRLKSRLTVDATTNAVTLKAPSFEVQTTEATSLQAKSFGLKTSEATTFQAASVRVEAGTTSLSFTSTPAKLTAEAPALELKAGDASVSLNATSRTLLCQGANVQITNGSGKTDQLNGFGNLLLGYNEPNPNPPVPNADKLKYRQGSHNLVVGIKHTYFSYGALLVGEEHASLAKFASVSGGQGNAASKAYASVSGGQGNTASGDYASVSSGQGNTASGDYASVSGGQANNASGDYASVSGGQANNAGQALGMPTPPATHTYVCGGNKNYATSVNGVVCSSP